MELMGVHSVFTVHRSTFNAQYSVFVSFLVYVRGLVYQWYDVLRYESNIRTLEIVFMSENKKEKCYCNYYKCPDVEHVFVVVEGRWKFSRSAPYNNL